MTPEAVQALATALDEMYRPTVVANEEGWSALMTRHAERILAALPPRWALVDMDALLRSLRSFIRSEVTAMGMTREHAVVMADLVDIEARRLLGQP